MRTEPTEPTEIRPAIRPDRRRIAAAVLLRDLRRKGEQFKLDPDLRGFRLRSPDGFPITPDLDDQVYELRDETIHQLRIEKREREQPEQPGRDDLSLSE